MLPLSGQFKPKRRLRRRRRDGAAIVEFAVVAPVLILILFGMIECGRMIMVQQSLATAAREGARAASLPGVTRSEARQVAEKFLIDVGVRGATVKVRQNAASVTHGEPFTVSISVPFKKVSWLRSPLFLGQSTLRSSATMRRESPE